MTTAREIAQDIYDRATRDDWPSITVDRIERALLAERRRAIEECAGLHESVNPASDHERQHNVPGAGAMGAVIEYRDKIRSLASPREET